MKRKFKILSVIIIVLIAIFSYFSAYPFIIKTMEKSHNAQIDYSCNTDKDCVIKTAGCSMCSGTYGSCMNKDSIEGVCYRGGDELNCDAITLSPTACMCVDNKCEGILYCFDGQCFDMGGNPIDIKCAIAGEEIEPEEYNQGIRCCDGLTEMVPGKWLYPCNSGEICQNGCVIVPPYETPWVQCSSCGNIICESEYGENECNCPEDC